MVADYSSYLEFIGAVYFTMSLSDYLTTKIWSPQDTKKISRSAAPKLRRNELKGGVSMNI